METNRLYDSKQIKEKLNINNSDLAKLRNRGKISYQKVNSRKFIYELNEELKKEFLSSQQIMKNSSITSEEEFAEYQLGDSNLEFPIVNSYYQHMKEQKKLNSFQQRDVNIPVYRRLAKKPEIQNSIEEIINEIVSPFEDGKIVKIDFSDDNKEIGEKTETRKAFQDSFDKCLRIMDFKSNAFYLVLDWYIDGLLPLECIYDNNKPKEGIKDLIKMSPVYLRDVKDKNSNKPYYLYEKNLETINNQNLQNYLNVYKDEQVILVGSGLWDDEKICEISYLQSSVKAINDLSHIENGIIKYRITRASEKNVWNIDVGTMAKNKAEQHLTSVAREISSNIKYDTSTGETNLDSTEGITSDWVFPSRNGKQKTEVTTINGNSDFISKLDDLEYFRRKLYEALKIPVGRLDGDSSLDYSAMDILREELKFTKFISRLRTQFNSVFFEFMQRDMVAKGDITSTDFYKFKQDVQIKWNQSNQIIENAEIENTQKRFEIITEIEDSGIIGKYIPIQFVVDRILKMTSKEFEEYQKQIEVEKKSGLIKSDDED